MSNARFSILQARAVSDENVSDAQFRTLSALGCYGDKGGWCFPSLQTLGEDLHKSPQAVSKDIAKLVELGYVEKHARYQADGSRRSNLYRLKFDTPYKPEDDTPSTSEVDTPSTPEVDTPSTSEVEVNDPINGQSNELKEAAFAADLSIENQIYLGKNTELTRPGIIQQAIRKHFSLTPNWETKTARQFMQWALQEEITAEQIKTASDKWKTDKRFNWSVATLKAIAEHWLELIANTSPIPVTTANQPKGLSVAQQWLEKKGIPVNGN